MKLEDIRQFAADVRKSGADRILVDLDGFEKLLAVAEAAKRDAHTPYRNNLLSDDVHRALAAVEADL